MHGMITQREDSGTPSPPLNGLTYQSLIPIVTPRKRWVLPGDSPNAVSTAAMFAYFSDFEWSGKMELAGFRGING